MESSRLKSRYFWLYYLVGPEHEFVRAQRVMYRKPLCNYKHLHDLMEDSRTCSMFDSSDPVAFIESLRSISGNVRGSDIIYVTDPQSWAKRSKRTRASDRPQRIELDCHRYLYSCRTRVDLVHETRPQQVETLIYWRGPKA